MTIRINDNAVDFTLEHEQTFADLHDSLDVWAKTADLVLLSVLADGRALLPNDSTPLQTIREIDVEAVPASDGDQARASVLSGYFTLVARAAGDPEALVQLRTQYGSVRAAIFPLMAPISHRVGDALAVLDDDWSHSSLADSALQIAQAAADLARDLGDPYAAVAEALRQLEASLPSELATLFQKGNDKDGFTRILAFFTAYENLARRADLAFRSVPDERARWTEFQQELQPFLAEARDALATKDHILLTDLLEYELVPRLSSAGDRFPASWNLDRPEVSL